MRISEARLRSIIRSTISRLDERQDDVYLELFNAIDTLSQLIARTSEGSIDKDARRIFKTNAGTDPESGMKMGLEDGTALSFDELKTLLRQQAEKSVSDFTASSLPLSPELIDKYTSYARAVVAKGEARPEEIASQLKSIVTSDYKNLGGGGVSPREGSAVGIDQSLKAAWKEAAALNPDFWDAFQTWTNLDYTQKGLEGTWTEIFMQEMETRLNDNQPLSCVGAPVITDRMPRELKVMLSGMSGKIHVQVDGTIEFASKTDANTQHTRKYDPAVAKKEKSVDLTFISSDRGVKGGDNMLTGAPGEPLFDGSYNEIIVSNWSPGAGLALPSPTLFKEIRETIEIAKVMYPAYQEFLARNPGYDDPQYKKFKGDSRKYRDRVPAFKDFIEKIAKVYKADPDDPQFWTMVQIADPTSQTISFFPGLFRYGLNAEPSIKYFYTYLINHVTHLYDAGFNLFPPQELENYKGLLKYFFKL